MFKLGGATLGYMGVLASVTSTFTHICLALRCNVRLPMHCSFINGRSILTLSANYAVSFRYIPVLAMAKETSGCVYAIVRASAILMLTLINI